ncbi:MAG: hypothetical protein GY861_26565 [bacterium]|nr:hypothetical protein [bacterium]
MIPKNVLVVYFRRHYGTLTYVRRILDKKKIKYTYIKRKHMRRKHFKRKDLIITIGGDGTFLKTSHHVSNGTLMLGVCSNPKKNVGYLLRSSRKDFEKHMGLIVQGKFKIKNLSKLETTINGKKTSYALNDVFLGSRRAYQTSRYKIRIGNKEEFQMSSGVIVSTPTGSTAWIKSAGGKEMPLHSKNFQYVVRDPYACKFTKPKMLKGLLSPKQTITIKSLIFEGVVAIDSSKKEYKIDEDSVVKVKLAKHPLKIIDF